MKEVIINSIDSRDLARWNHLFQRCSMTLKSYFGFAKGLKLNIRQVFGATGNSNKGALLPEPLHQPWTELTQ